MPGGMARICAISSYDSSSKLLSTKTWRRGSGSSSTNWRTNCRVSWEMHLASGVSAPDAGPWLSGSLCKCKPSRCHADRDRSRRRFKLSRKTMRAIQVLKEASPRKLSKALHLRQRVELHRGSCNRVCFYPGRWLCLVGRTVSSQLLNYQN